MAKVVDKASDDEPLAGDAKTPAVERPVCGIVRPIAEMGTYSASHWRDVHEIIVQAVESAGYRPRLVSESDAVGVILADIVGNLYNDPVVIADVSGRNPNVMFELGMRIAFEKPVVIITDDDTPFSFDISPIKHIPYPRSLRYGDIVKLKEDVALAIAATLKAAASPNHRGYLQQFGPIEVTQIGSHEVGLDAIVAGLEEVKRAVRSISSRADVSPAGNALRHGVSKSLLIEAFHLEGRIDEDVLNAIRDLPRVQGVQLRGTPDSPYLEVAMDARMGSSLRSAVVEEIGNYLAQASLSE